MRSFLKFPKNDHVSTHPPKKKHMDFEKTAFQKKMADSIFCVIMSVMEGLGFIDRSVNSQGHPPQTGQAADCAPRKENTCPRKLFRNGFESLQGNDCYHSQWICLRENSQERRVVPSTIKNVEVSSKLSLKLKTNPMTFNWYGS